MVGVERSQMQQLAARYDAGKVTLGCIGSHSALDLCDGAVDEGLPTLVVCQRGRDAPYSRFLRTARTPEGERRRGIVDQTLVLPAFKDVLAPHHRKALRDANVIFVPNRSFTSYCGASAIEEQWDVPLFGSRALLASEERGSEKDYYWLLEKAGLPFPEPVASPEEIDGLVIVKLRHAQKALERGFFTAATYEQFLEKATGLIRSGVITQQDLDLARIERYVIGPVFNLNFFYSPLEHQAEPIELLGIDWRFETSLDGHVRLPAAQQLSLEGPQAVPEYTVCGHNSATLRESLLQRAYELAEAWVEAAARHHAPGIIGPFCLQTCVDKDLGFWIYDVAPRVGGGTNVHMALGHPYGNSLWRKPMSTGRRIAKEIATAAAQGRLPDIVT